jgi:cysteine-S-conjugate beta-lyase
VSDPARALEDVDPFDDVSLELLRLRRSAKWSTHPRDVLPAWVAEMDFDLAAPIHETLQAAIARNDAGYPHIGRLPEVFVAFAAARFGWQVEPSRIRACADVMSAVAELLRALTEPGDGVVINPPVYPPFFGVTRDVGREVVAVPLERASDVWRLDLDGTERAFAAGARAYLLCHPQNPTGTSFSRGELEAVATLAERYGVAVIADEVHAPLTMQDAAHVPYVTVARPGADAASIVSASKAWNVPGLKCALIVSGSDAAEQKLAESLPTHLAMHTGHLGVLAAVAAFEHGGEWLDALLRHLDRNRHLLADLLAEHLPQVRYVPPDAGYLAWLDCRELGLGDDPSEVFLARGRVALSGGPPFGGEGSGFARLNFGTSSALLEDAVRRMAASV